MRKVHELKVWPEYFDLLISGKKSFEVRKNDRDFQVGDRLDLMEWNPKTEKYTGNHVHREVTYILGQGNPFIELGDNVIMSIR